LAEALILIEGWRRRYNTIWLQSFLGYRQQASEATMPLRLPLGSASLHLPPPLAMEAALH
jgi:hypothetical protein